ncbi:tetratricopeptide repeat protein [Lentzea tibetensis]|uniref:Tetratricopeptide repeat protein n=1 Tax=Lentzea tibetensis TaxID=2591470 RepID=A0A563F3B8_9PSEU|nr:tetratricopeptide repeat protein [Lentzea tibetensis]TWP54261.1 tetratricopeptide repeat protein [Lentzea tibetensis]
MAAVHRMLVLVDVAGFGDPRRTDIHQVAVRDALYELLVRVFSRCGVPWDSCDHEDRGDGVLVLVPPRVPKSVFAETLPRELVAALREHNDACGDEEQIRLRLALHAGEIHYDAHGVAGTAVNLAFRLLDAPVLKRALASSSSSLAVITSAWFHDEVVWHSLSADRDRYLRVRVRAKETDATAWICLPDCDLPADLGVADGSVPRQLPVVVSRFVGRSSELDRLCRLLDSGVPSGTVVITAIDGSAGIGKTTLALHWAHRVKDSFPDGQLHVNLRGFDPGEPMDPGEALHGFLQALGVATNSIPADLAQRAALYRSLLADRRVLVVLDNARSSEHVRPLLPASPGCVVLVTSRRRLDGLTVQEGANRIALDVLSTEDSLALLVARSPRFGDEPVIGAELAALCGRLPLALSIIAAHAAVRPSLPLRSLVRELRDEHDRLDALSMADLSVRAVFSWSYRVLTPDAARLFRLLGLHPGPDVSLDACAALSSGVRELLAELTAAHLIAEHVPGRYRFHDLLRAYAAEQALGSPAAERTSAASAMLDHYLSLAFAADRAIQPCRDGVVRAPGVDVSTYTDGMAWFTAESEVLQALVAFAAAHDFAGHAWRLAWACTTFLRRSGRWRERVAVHRTALAAARRAGDAEGQATASRHLGSALGRLGSLDEASEVLHEALELNASSSVGLFRTHLAFNRILQARGDHETALSHAQQAWSLVHATADHLVRADALNTLGKQLALVERHAEGLPLCEQALRDYLVVGHLEGQADVLINIGEIEQRLGLPISAIDRYRRSIDIDRQLGDRYWEAEAYDHLGDAHCDAGDLEQAVRSWYRSAMIFTELRHRDAERVRAKASARALD